MRKKPVHSVKKKISTKKTQTKAKKESLSNLSIREDKDILATSDKKPIAQLESKGQPASKLGEQEEQKTTPEVSSKTDTQQKSSIVTLPTTPSIATSSLQQIDKPEVLGQQSQSKVEQNISSPSKSEAEKASVATSPQQSFRDETTQTIQAIEPAVIDTTPAIEVEKVTVEGKHRKLLIAGMLILAFGAGAGTVFLIYSLKSKPEEKKATSASVVTATPSATLVSVTPTPAFDPAVWSFEVLNGSGIAGVAKKTADKLSTSGFKVVTIGNTEKQNYQKSELHITASMSAQGSILLDRLKDIISISSVSGALKDSTAAARIIVGRE